MPKSNVSPTIADIEAAIPDILPTDSNALLHLKEETRDKIFHLSDPLEKITALISALTKTHRLGRLFWQARQPESQIGLRLAQVLQLVLTDISSPSLEKGTLKTLNDELVKLLKNSTIPESLFNAALVVIHPTDAASLKKCHLLQLENHQNPFLSLPPDIFRILYNYFDPQSKRAVSLTARRLHTLFKPRLELEGLLHHIAKREDSRVINIRNSLQTQSPANLFTLLLHAVKYWNQAAIDAILKLCPLGNQSPENLATLLRQSVAYGNQDLAESILKIHPDLLLEKGTFSDYARIYEDDSDNYKPARLKIPVISNMLCGPETATCGK